MWMQRLVRRSRGCGAKCGMRKRLVDMDMYEMIEPYSMGVVMIRPSTSYCSSLSLPRSFTGEYHAKCGETGAPYYFAYHNSLVQPLSKCQDLWDRTRYVHIPPLPFPSQGIYVLTDRLVLLTVHPLKYHSLTGLPFAIGSRAFSGGWESRIPTEVGTISLPTIVVGPSLCVTPDSILFTSDRMPRAAKADSVQRPCVLVFVCA